MIIHIIGLGPTAQHFKPDGNITIGVNDEFFCDYQVCVDRPKAFNGYRLNTIIGIILSDRCKAFYSHLEEWNICENFRKIELKAVHAHNDRWNEFIPSSNNSPFVACGVAYKYFNATEIILWGCDFLNHQHLNGEMREQTVRDFKLLQGILNKKGCVIKPHPNSYLYGKI